MSSTVTFPLSLPSKITFYSRFNGSSWNCNEDVQSFKELQTKLEAPLMKYQGASDKAKKIISSYCYASKMKEAEPKDDAPCHFFYYWLGDMLPKGQMEDRHFKNDINTICIFVKDEYKGKGCNVICENIERETYDHRKTILEYSFDYNRIEKDLLKNGPICQQKWTQHRSGVLSACNAVSDKCPEEDSKNNDPYCKDFKDKYKFYCGMAKALDLYCTTKSALASAQAAASSAAEEATRAVKSKLDEAESKANKASTLSSTFGTLALMELPALAYFLFKYKPWSSWFSNNSNGRSRRKRSTERSTFDTLTENSSTYDSATESIGGISAAEDSIVRSPVYTGQSRTGRSTKERERTNNNAGGRGIVGYQNI